MGQRNARFRHSDEFNGMLRGDREGKRLRIGQADIFTCKNDDAARDKTKIFTGVQHFRQPINRAFFVRRAHALNERADGVVMRIAFLVIHHRFALNTFFRDLKREMDDRIRRGDALPRVLLFTGAGVTDSGYRRRCQHANFERIQTFACVAVAQLGQMPPRISAPF